MNLYKSALDLFYQICEIPHPSGRTKDLQKFIIYFLTQCKCEVKTDSAGNIHALKGAPKLVFQAHYDMVLVGQKIEPFIDGDFLKSRDSSLGADNGASFALLLTLAKECQNFELLLTNDEEIGMIGAKNIALHTQSKTMINLDSECLNEICIGCAGGFDADISLAKFWQEANLSQEFYELSAQHFKGGHSGIDIDKNIKNAIVELLWVLDSLRKTREFSILDISGGENRNSIPIHAKAVIAIKSINDSCESPLNSQDSPHISMKKLKSFTPKNAPKSLNSAVVPYLLRLHNGIYEKSGECITSSLNFSLISRESLKIMIRANNAEFLSRHESRLKSLFGTKNIAISGFYNAWDGESSEILSRIKNLYQKHKIRAQITQIHAGLECGILKEKCALCEIISIGPTILHPHSKNEMLDLKSFAKFCEIIENLAK